MIHDILTNIFFRLLFEPVPSISPVKSSLGTLSVEGSPKSSSATITAMESPTKSFSSSATYTALESPAKSLSTDNGQHGTEETKETVSRKRFANFGFVRLCVM